MLPTLKSRREGSISLSDAGLPPFGSGKKFKKHVLNLLNSETWERRLYHILIRQERSLSAKYKSQSNHCKLHGLRWQSEGYDKWDVLTIELHGDGLRWQSKFITFIERCIDPVILLFFLTTG